jgi:hypothetical protein
MLRHLLRLDRRNGGMLLVNIVGAARPRWTVTLGALRRLAPQWFVIPARRNPRRKTFRAASLRSVTEKHVECTYVACRGQTLPRLRL